MFQKEQGEAFQNQPKSKESHYCKEILKKTPREKN